MVIGITLAHYFTPHNLHFMHGIYRRMYYIPIIISALQFGIYETLGVTTIITIFYIPHAFFSFPYPDPSRTEEKILEIALYFLVAYITGMMQNRVQKEFENRKKTESLLRFKDRITSMGELSAGFAHEIRNPLASIKGAAELLQEYFHFDEERKKLLNLIVKESNRLEKIVEKFLNFANPQITLITNIDIPTLIQETVELLKNHPSAKGKNIFIKPFPSDKKDFMAKGDFALLKQVFFNIGLNALQSMKEDGLLTIEFEFRNEQCAVIFKDNGEGMDADEIERCFDPFWTKKKNGTGLGLSISYRIVQELNGDIIVESIKGKGSTFTVLLPEAKV